MKSNTWFVFCLFSLLVSCVADPNYSNIPAIAYEKIEKSTLVDALGNQQIDINCTISYIDGDGDLGLSVTDSMPPFHLGDSVLVDGLKVFEPNMFYYNYFIDVYKKNDGVFEKIVFPDGDLGYKGRFPRLTNVGYATPIDGQISYSMRFAPALTSLYEIGDTLYFEIRIYDRARNISNKAITSEIVL